MRHTYKKINNYCILFLFFDPVKKVIANVHSGWRGTFQKIWEKAIRKMIEYYKCDPKDILCFISLFLFVAPPTCFPVWTIFMRYSTKNNLQLF